MLIKSKMELELQNINYIIHLSLLDIVVGGNGIYVDSESTYCMWIQDFGQN
jgi:hypothetical protein